MSTPFFKKIKNFWKANYVHWTPQISKKRSWSNPKKYIRPFQYKTTNLQGRRQPSKDTLEKLAQFFNVSTDYLLGNSELKNPEDQLSNVELLFRKTSKNMTPEQKETFQKELLEFMEIRRKAFEEDDQWQKLISKFGKSQKKNSIHLLSYIIFPKSIIPLKTISITL